MQPAITNSDSNVEYLLNSFPEASAAFHGPDDLNDRWLDADFVFIPHFALAALTPPQLESKKETAVLATSTDAAITNAFLRMELRKTRQSYRGLIRRMNPIIAQNAARIMNALKKVRMAKTVL